MASTSGRRVVVPLTNKSGGGVIAGDVVIVDTANNEAFTTTTTSAYTGSVGVAQETIASNATGRVATSGYVALVNVNASVTRGNYGTTHTVAKQATDGGASRVTGAFCQFLTGGTTPTAQLFGLVDVTGASGAVATDAIWDAAGDLAVGSGANTAAKLSKGSALQGLRVNSGATNLEWANIFTGNVSSVAPYGIGNFPASATTAVAQRAQAAPVQIPGQMLVRSCWINCTVAGSGSLIWGLFDYSSNAASCTQLATGTAAPGGTGFREIAATGAPVTVAPGNYMLIVYNPAANASTIQVANAGLVTGFWKAFTTYTWTTTPDLTSGSWADATGMWDCWIEGDLLSGTRW